MERSNFNVERQTQYELGQSREYHTALRRLNEARSNVARQEQQKSRDLAALKGNEFGAEDSCWRKFYYDSDFCSKLNKDRIRRKESLLEKELAQARKHLKTMEEQVELVGRQVRQNVQMRYRRLVEQEEGARRQYEADLAQLGRLESESLALPEKIRQARSDVDSLRYRLDTKGKELQSVRSHLTRADENYRRYAHDSGWNELISRRDELTSLINQQEQEIERLNSAISNLGNKILRRMSGKWYP
ncbi:MAG: hypothetical protein NZ480_04905 [Bdellovibrionaceae bacterium]|nr:hypothetical protein [Pseudobdellovibrionaceae bacterium]MDW8191111.1 hypothetical protein [Pseudobdellovibrionaceae bacterium]